MSFRNTFVTDYIYQASDEVKAANVDVTSVFEEHVTSLNSKVDGRGYGYYSGILGTSSLNLDDLDSYIRELVTALEKVTKVPFRLTVMQESGAVITWPVEPRNKS